MNIPTTVHRGGELIPVSTKEPVGRPGVEAHNGASWLEILAQQAAPETRSCKGEKDSGPSPPMPVRVLPRVKNRPPLNQEFAVPTGVAPIVFPQWMPLAIAQPASLEMEADGDGNCAMESAPDSLNSPALSSSSWGTTSSSITPVTNLSMLDSRPLMAMPEPPQQSLVLAPSNPTESVAANTPTANAAASETKMAKREEIAADPSAAAISANEKAMPDTTRSSLAAEISGINLVPTDSNKWVANGPDLNPQADSTTTEGAEALAGADAPDKPGTIHGMTAAQQDGTMKPRQERAEIAEWFSRGFLARQNPTGDGRRVQPVFTANWRSNHSIETRAESVVATNQASLAITEAKTEIFSEAMEVATAAPMTQLRANIVEQSVHFKRTGLDSLEVVLKPDSQMEIRLHFVTRDGQVEARAHCERGDTSQLRAEWNQLQDSLMKQGIRLLPLGDLPIGSGGLGGHSDAPRQFVPPPEPSNATWLTTKPTTSVPLVSKAEHSAIQRVMNHLGLLDSWA